MIEEYKKNYQQEKIKKTPKEKYNIIINKLHSDKGGSDELFIKVKEALKLYEENGDSGELDKLYNEVTQIEKGNNIDINI